MNDEIKEILYKLDSISNGAYNNDGYVDLKQNEAHLLLDYITNLQEDVRTGKEINAELKQENERLKELNENASKVCMAEHRYGVDKAEEARDYKSCCEKASEYINKLYNLYYEQGINFEIMYKSQVDNLLNILQNGSDDNE